jgi:carbonic anhydrase/acetyltransferase-like protein (isoleucine patch superfamily)
LRGELWGGNPAKKMRDLTPEQMAGFYAQCAAYAANAAKFKAGLVAVGE